METYLGIPSVGRDVLSFRPKIFFLIFFSFFFFLFRQHKFGSGSGKFAWMAFIFEIGLP